MNCRMTSGIDLKGGKLNKTSGGHSVESCILVFHLLHDLPFLRARQLFPPPGAFPVLVRVAKLIPRALALYTVRRGTFILAKWAIVYSFLFTS